MGDTLRTLLDRLDAHIKEQGLAPMPSITIDWAPTSTEYRLDVLVAALRRMGNYRFVYELPGGTEREVPHPMDPIFDEVVSDLGLEGKEDSFHWVLTAPDMDELYDAYRGLMERLRDIAALIEDCPAAREKDLFKPWEELEKHERTTYTLSKVIPRIIED